MNLPLVSCIMPVADRHEFLPGALACFEAQDWPERELVIIDNGKRDCAALVLGLPGVVYHRVPHGKHTIGALRNIACSRASGEIICHVDSDDWYGPGRIREQMRTLEETGMDATGYNVLCFADDRLRRAWVYRHSSPYACGATLMYRRRAWERHPFDIRSKWGEDNTFVAAAKRRLASTDGDSIVARIHAAATCPKSDMLANWAGGSTWQEISYDDLAGRGYPVVTESIHQ